MILKNNFEEKDNKNNKSSNEVQFQVVSYAVFHTVISVTTDRMFIRCYNLEFLWSLYQTICVILHIITLIGYVSQNSMVPVMMSLHLSEVPETSAAYVTFYSKLITVLSLVLFEVPYVRGTVLTLVTFMHFSCMILGITDQIYFPHEVVFTSSFHTHMSFYFFVSVFDFVSVQITFEWVIFSTFFTHKFVPSSMRVPVSL